MRRLVAKLRWNTQVRDQSRIEFSGICRDWGVDGDPSGPMRAYLTAAALAFDEAERSFRPMLAQERPPTAAELKTLADKLRSTRIVVENDVVRVKKG